MVSVLRMSFILDEVQLPDEDLTTLYSNKQELENQCYICLQITQIRFKWKSR
jgi:hypothetical protein